MKRHRLLLFLGLALLILALLFGIFKNDADSKAKSFEAQSIQQQLSELKTQSQKLNASENIVNTTRETDAQLDAIYASCTQAQSLSKRASKLQATSKISMSAGSVFSADYSEAQKKSDQLKKDASDLGEKLVRYSGMCDYYADDVADSKKIDTVVSSSEYRRYIAFSLNCDNPAGCVISQDVYDDFAIVYDKTIQIQKENAQNFSTRKCPFADAQQVCEGVSTMAKEALRNRETYVAALRSGNAQSVSAAAKVSSSDSPSFKKLVEDVQKLDASATSYTLYVQNQLRSLEQSFRS